MTRPAPLSPEAVRVSLIVGAVVRAKARVAEADRALARALQQARAVGYSEQDVDAARRMISPTGEEQGRAVAILAATGAEVSEAADPPREQISDIDAATFEAMIWRQGWFAAVWNEPLDLSRWSGPADAWKARLFREGYIAFGEAVRDVERARMKAPAKAVAA